MKIFIKYLLVFIFLLNIILVFRPYLTAQNQPKRPENIHKEAVWNDAIGCWDYSDKAGNIILWTKDGKIRAQTQHISPTRNIEIRYHSNGKISSRGIEGFFSNLDEEDGSTGWFAIGKWKEFYESGKIKQEYCYTPVKSEYVYWTVDKCGTEIIYNEDGTVKEKIEHKLQCKYGCDEPPVEDGNK